MPTEIVIAPVAGQVAGVQFDVTGTATLTPALQIAEDTGAYSTALPAGATVSAYATAYFSIPHAFAAAGRHTVSVQDTKTGAVTTSNPVTVTAPPAVVAPPPVIVAPVIVASPITPSPDRLTIAAPTTASLIDASLAAWTIVNGVVMRNGIAAGYSANVVELALVSDVIWQVNAGGRWSSWNGTTWTGTGVSSPLVPTPTS